MDGFPIILSLHFQNITRMPLPRTINLLFGNQKITHPLVFAFFGSTLTTLTEPRTLHSPSFDNTLIYFRNSRVGPRITNLVASLQLESLARKRRPLPADLSSSVIPVSVQYGNLFQTAHVTLNSLQTLAEKSKSKNYLNSCHTLAA